MEQCEQKTILDFINEQWNEEGAYDIDEDTIQLIFGQIVSAVLYLLKQRRMVHRDLKPDNMLMKNSKSGEPVVKLCDFGFTRTIANEMTTVIGTQMYVDPRVGKDSYGSEADLYSLGCVLHNLYFGYHAYTIWDDDAQEYVKCDELVMTDSVKESPEGELLMQLLTKNHLDRITWEEFQENAYVVEALKLAKVKEDEAAYYDEN